VEEAGPAVIDIGRRVDPEASGEDGTDAVGFETIRGDRPSFIDAGFMGGTPEVEAE